MDRRFRQHKHSLLTDKSQNIRLQRSFNKYGKDNFIFCVLEYCTNIIEREQFYIDTLNPVFNLRRIAESNAGYKWTEEQKQHQSEVHKGLPSPKKGIKTGKPAWNRGIPQTEETKKKLSIVNKGRRNSIKSEFKPGEINCKIVPVRCVELDIIFKSYADAARFTGNVKNYSNIVACTKGKQKTAYGYHWESVKE